MASTWKNMKVEWNFKNFKGLFGKWNKLAEISLSKKKYHWKTTLNILMFSML